MLGYLTVEIFGQTVGFIALFFVFLAFKETDDRKLIILLALGSGIWGLHFSLIGLFAAAGINTFDVFKNIIGLKYKKNNYWLSFFIFSYIIIGITSFLYTSNIVSFLPTIASIVGAIAIFLFKGIPLRLILLTTLGIWFIYNIIGGSYAGMFSDIILIGATIYGIYKLKNMNI